MTEFSGNSRNIPPKGTSVNRRQFFRFFLAESVGLINEMKGIPQCNVDEIKNLPDTVIKKIIPVFNYSPRYQLENNQLWRYDHGSQKQHKIYDFSEIEMSAMQMFNGKTNLEVVSHDLCRHYDLNENEMFTIVRNLFILLAEFLVYVPLVPYEPDSDFEYEK